MRPILPALLLCLLLAGCGRARETRAPRAADSSAAAVPPAPAPTPPPVTYRFVPIPNAAALRALADTLGAEGMKLVLTVNRVDLLHIREGDSLVVPSRLDAAALCPFPAALPAADTLAKLLIVSARVQAFAVYDSGRLVRWGPTSTGREETPTPAGLYHTNWKDQQRNSTFNEEWDLRWYVNLHNGLGISLHLYDLPGRPASHSCVRLTEEDAKWLYDWAVGWTLSPDRRTVLRHGSPVIVLDAYAFDRPRPWRRLVEDPSATTVAPAELDAAIARHLAPGRGGVARAGATSYTPAPTSTVTDS